MKPSFSRDAVRHDVAVFDETVSDELVAAARAGDNDARRGLYERSRVSIYRLIRRMIGREEAEDVFQQVFLKAFTAIDEFAGQSRFETWLFRIAINESLQHLRQRSRKRVVPLEFELMDETPDHDRRYDGAELLQQALERLDPELRSVFVLREVEQLSYRELAETLGISEGTVASRLNRARRLLKQYLTELGWEA